MNIILIGMRGSGKTTVGKLLAKKFKREFIDMDNLIVEKAGMTIPKIVETYGWEYFRSLEAEIVYEVAKLDNKVIAAGGGVVTRTENIRLLKENGILFLLRTTVATLLSRIRNAKDRPLLTEAQTFEEDLKKVFRDRKNLYMDVAEVVIDTDTLNPRQIVELVTIELQGKGIWK